MTNTNQQPAVWNGAAGHAWVETQDLLDVIFKPVETLLVDRVVAAQPAHVLDVGCGTGATTVAAALALAGEARCTGVDISEPMLAAARTRAEQAAANATFLCADAQTHPFEPASFDFILSRFGVMFFDDPVAAFHNIRRATRPDAQLYLAVWRSAADNPFMTVAERAARALLPDLPERSENAPGQFGFSDPQRVTRILEAASWNAIDIQPTQIPCSFPENDLVRYFTRLGPVGLALSGADDHLRTRVVETVLPAFDHYTRGTEVHFEAGLWLISAAAR